MSTNKLYIGAHITISGGLHKIVDRTMKMDANCLQIFIANRLSTTTKVSFTKADLHETRKLLEQNKLLLYIHAPYTINLCRISTKLTSVILKQFEIGSELDAKGIIVHVGKHMEFKPEEGAKNMLNNIINVIKKLDNSAPPFGQGPSGAAALTPFVLETPAGQGSELFVNIDNFIKFYKLVIEQLKKAKISSPEKRFKICIDTAHVFAAGQADFSKVAKTKEFFNKIIKEIGPNAIALIHLNDSFVPFGAEVDHHANLGKGFIGNGKVTPFKEIAKIARKYRIPMVLETPEISDKTHYNEIRSVS